MLVFPKGEKNYLASPVLTYITFVMLLRYVQLYP